MDQAPPTAAGLEAEHFTKSSSLQNSSGAGRITEDVKTPGQQPATEAMPARTSDSQKAGAISRTPSESHKTLFKEAAAVMDKSVSNLASKFVVNRRLAVYNARGQSTHWKSRGIGSVASTERRLPGDGGPAAPRAHRDLTVIAKACDGIPIFQGLHRDDRRALYENMYQLQYNPGEKVVVQGEEGRNFYVIVQGSPVVRIKKDDGPDDKQDEAKSPPSESPDCKSPTTSIMDKGKGAAEPAAEPKEIVKRMYPGDTFGEVALLHACPRSATVAAEDSLVKVWALDCVTFKQLLSKAAFRRRTRFVKLLSSVPLLAPLTDYNRLQLADALEAKSYAPNQDIIVQGDVETACFHIIEKGEVSVLIENGTREVNKLGEGDFFGEVTLLGELQPPTATVRSIVVTDTVTLDRAAFRRLLGTEALKSTFSTTMKRYVFEANNDKGNLGRMSRVSTAVVSGAINHSSNGLRALFKPLGMGALKLKTMYGPGKPRDDPLMLGKGLTRNDFKFLKELGVGMSAVVYLAMMPSQNNRLVVMKMMKKTKLLRLNQVDNVMREKELLQAYRSPFIVSSYGSFQDEAYLYLILEYVAGGELFSLLVELRVVPVDTARVYAAQVLLALEYIHNSGHVYRDLKPENMLLAGDGHLKLADLGFCKPLKRGEKTYTTCGTADYMAPEVMLCQGHDKAADYWAFGVFIFEMLAGCAPFESRSESERYNKILRGLLVFPEDFNLQARDIVSKLCVVDVSKRLGCNVQGVEEIKEHPFFAELNWVIMSKQKNTPPYVPKVTPEAQLQAITPLQFREQGKIEEPKEVKKAFERF
eukprot:CAMPEP_0114238804 /NCGR_PEP_ID=MMETSP0058-20121206/8116_1 /TAXON_ID=36894 /ORGANISM="Pyramimonas parkeae, CCMP726" /LENGTH=813 /DNA_ID=CAMNT_0001350931 /DNA_START=367 /DNA_END=2807 /DNA_ORIENTATION=-